MDLYIKTEYTMVHVDHDRTSTWKNGLSESCIITGNMRKTNPIPIKYFKWGFPIIDSLSAAYTISSYGGGVGGECG